MNLAEASNLAKKTLSNQWVKWIHRGSAPTNTATENNSKFHKSETLRVLSEYERVLFLSRIKVPKILCTKIVIAILKTSEYRTLKRYAPYKSSRITYSMKETIRKKKRCLNRGDIQYLIHIVSKKTLKNKRNWHINAESMN